MRLKHLLLIGILWIAEVCAGFCQPPPNDDFANRVQLLGSDVLFTGDVTDATSEPGEWINCLCTPATNSRFPNHTLWWTWTAPETTQVHLVVQSRSLLDDDSDILAVYAGTNVFGVYPAKYVWLTPGWDKLTLSFQADAGTSYQIQFLSYAKTMTATLELIATNAPLILQPPKDQTVFTNGAALFTVVAAGIPPLHYQWRFNGSDIPGANDPMLALDSLSADQTGDYTVVVSNFTGFATSSPARLNVNTTASPPSLDAVKPSDSNAFSFILKGESGRYYRIESSTDLKTWQPEAAFPNRSPVITNRYPTTYGSVVFAASSNLLFNIPRTAGAKYLRASVYTPFNEICNLHQRQIRFAKDLWARDAQQSWNAGPSADDLEPYCANLEQLSCPLVGGPLGSSYTIGSISNDPSCKVAFYTHRLEESP